MRRVSQEIVTFVAVGTAAAALYGLIAPLFVHATALPPPLAAAAAYAAVLPGAYLAQRSLTFRSDAPHSRAFGRYAAAQLLGVGTAAGCAAAAGPDAGFALYAASALLAGAISFGVQKLWVFARW